MNEDGIQQQLVLDTCDQCGKPVVRSSRFINGNQYWSHITPLGNFVNDCHVGGLERTVHGRLP